MRVSVGGDAPRPLCGAYGLCIEGKLFEDEVNPSYLVGAEANWPKWEMDWEPLVSSDPEDSHSPSLGLTWTPNRAVQAAQPSGHITIDRVTARTTLHLSKAPSGAALVHPYLSTTGMVAGHWLGRAPFHAGAFQFDGRAWGVLGGREMGKSSLLMHLHRSNFPILTDDLLVLHGDTAYTGPRCLDLRQSAAEHFQAGEYLGMLGTRERWRVTLPSAPSATPFGGWILLGWAEEPVLQVPSPSFRLSALASHRALTAPDATTDWLVDLLRFPMVVFGRPQNWNNLEGTTTQLLDALSAINQGKGRQA
jgi:hypothetical protein